jgi:hypothetical protein
VVAWRALAALAVVVAGIVAIFAVHTFGWRDGGGETSGHVFTLHQGEVIRVPSAATRCVASQEAGVPNLFCTRTPRGKYEFVFYSDSVVVWGPRGPDKETASYRWEPHP